MLDFTKDLIREANIDNGYMRVGIVTYSTNVVVEFQLNSYKTKTDLFTAVDRITYRYGSTNSAGGLNTARTEMFTVANGDREDVPNIVIIITDGVSNINARRTIPEAQETHAAGILVYAVGIGLRETKELDAMATAPASDNSFKVNYFNELGDLARKLSRAVCGGNLVIFIYHSYT